MTWDAGPDEVVISSHENAQQSLGGPQACRGKLLSAFKVMRRVETLTRVMGFARTSLH